MILIKILVGIIIGHLFMVFLKNGDFVYAMIVGLLFILTILAVSL